MTTDLALSTAQSPRHESEAALSKVLILGTTRGYDWPQLEPFVRSLAVVGFRGDTVLFGARTTRQTITTLNSHGVTVLPYRELSIAVGKRRNLRPEHVHLFSLARSRFCRGLSKWKPSALTSRTLLRAMGSLYGIWSARYLLYLDYLLNLSTPRRPDLVILTDVRDVIFQRDPSLLANTHAGLVVSLEDQSTTLGSCQENSEWLLRTYGRAVLRSLRDQPISCAGVTFGSYAGVLDYLRAMVDQLLTIPRDFHGADQAVHNFLLRSGSLSPFQEYANGQGPVLTLGTSSVYELSDHGDVLNADGSLPTIVHQYDRHPALARHIYAGIGRAA